MADTIVNNIESVNLESLDAEVRAVAATCTGLSYRKARSQVVLHFGIGVGQAEIAAAIAAVVAHNPTARTPEQQLFETIKTTAQSAVGVALNDLTAGQRNALMAILLWRAGGITKDGTIKSLAEWVR